MTPDVRLSAALAEIDTLRRRVATLESQHRLAVVEIPIPSIRLVVELVAAEWGVTPASLLSNRRALPYVEPRQVSMWITVKHLRHSLPRIGRCLLRDHTTVRHGARVVADRIDADPAFAARVQRVVASIPTKILEAP